MDQNIENINDFSQRSSIVEEIEKWRTRTDVGENVILSSGVIAGLFNGLLEFLKFLLQHFRTHDPESRHYRPLERSSTALLFWGSDLGVSHGDLDVALQHSCELRDTVLTILISIAELMSQGMIQFLPSNEDRREVLSFTDISTLIDNAKITMENSEEPEYHTQLSVEELCVSLWERVKTLSILSSSLECPAEDEYDEEEARAWADVQDRSAHEYFVDRVSSRFPLAASVVIDRLGQSNWDRYNLVRRQQEKAQGGFEDITNDKTKSFFQDSGISDSLHSLPKDRQEYEATVISSRAEASHKRLPPLPVAARSGEPFICNVCNESVKIRRARDWKKHIFADICAYSCVFDQCPFPRVMFPDCDALTDHMKAHHGFAQNSSQVCPLCQDQLVGGRDGFSLHLSRHMEEIALAVLPHGADSDDEASDGSEYSSFSTAANMLPHPKPIHAAPGIVDHSGRAAAPEIIDRANERDRLRRLPKENEKRRREERLRRLHKENEKRRQEENSRLLAQQIAEEQAQTRAKEEEKQARFKMDRYKDRESQRAEARLAESERRREEERQESRAREQKEQDERDALAAKERQEARTRKQKEQDEQDALAAKEKRAEEKRARADRLAAEIIRKEKAIKDTEAQLMGREPRPRDSRPPTRDMPNTTWQRTRRPYISHAQAQERDLLLAETEAQIAREREENNTLELQSNEAGAGEDLHRADELDDYREAQFGEDIYKAVSRDYVWNFKDPIFTSEREESNEADAGEDMFTWNVNEPFITSAPEEHITLKLRSNEADAGEDIQKTDELDDSPINWLVRPIKGIPEESLYSSDVHLQATFPDIGYPLFADYAELAGQSKDQNTKHGPGNMYDDSMAPPGAQSAESIKDTKALAESQGNIQCDYCGKQFYRKNRENLRRHIKSVHTPLEKRDPNLRCEICGMWFSRKDGKKVHMQRKHKGNKSDVESKDADDRSATPHIPPATTPYPPPS